jgi:6-phosphogluconolactonase
LTNVIRLKDHEAISQRALEIWKLASRKVIEEKGSFSIALSGGKTPRRLYELVASDTHRSEFDWKNTYVFFGDERRVAPTHEDSTYRIVKDLLVNHVPLPSENFFAMQGIGLASADARDYENALKKHFQLQRGEWPVFDLILLGMGADGHIASIFPGTRAVSDLTNMVVVYEVPKLHQERITLTTPVLSHARRLLFLVSGADKAPALASTLEGPYQPSTYPAQAIKPADGGEFQWLVDEDAASQLKKK